MRTCRVLLPSHSREDVRCAVRTAVSGGEQNSSQWPHNRCASHGASLSSQSLPRAVDVLCPTGLTWAHCLFRMNIPTLLIRVLTHPSKEIKQWWLKYSIRAVKILFCGWYLKSTYKIMFSFPDPRLWGREHLWPFKETPTLKIACIKNRCFNRWGYVCLPSQVHTLSVWSHSLTLQHHFSTAVPGLRVCFYLLVSGSRLQPRQTWWHEVPSHNDPKNKSTGTSSSEMEWDLPSRSKSWKPKEFR